MNFNRRIRIIVFLFLAFVQSCDAVWPFDSMGDSIGVKSASEFGINFGLNTLRECKGIGVAVGAFAAGTAKATLAVAIAHPFVSITVATGTVLYGGYRFYRRDALERAILALKESERIIEEKAAEAAREMLAREMHIKEEDAKMARELHEKRLSRN